jgi:hypothetical protein
MRARVESLIKILNRARPEVQVERNKTVTYAFAHVHTQTRDHRLMG